MLKPFWEDTRTRDVRETGTSRRFGDEKVTNIISCSWQSGCAGKGGGGGLKSGKREGLFDDRVDRKALYPNKLQISRTFNAYEHIDFEMKS